MYVLQAHTKNFFARIYRTRARAGAFHICDWEKIAPKIFLKKLLTFCSAFDIIHHVNRTTTRFEKIGRRSVEKKFLTSCVGCDRMSTTKQGTRLTAERAFELTVRVGRATCQVIPLCPPTCVCTLHGFKSTVCMHGGHTKVYPPTRTQGKAENTKNFFLTSCVGCDRIK